MLAGRELICLLVSASVILPKSLDNSSWNDVGLASTPVMIMQLNYRELSEVKARDMESFLAIETNQANHDTAHKSREDQY